MSDSWLQKLTFQKNKQLGIEQSNLNEFELDYFPALDQVLFEDVLDGGGEEGAILNEVFDGNTQGEDWMNGYTSAEFY